jgi:hypothetical protein
MNTINRETEIEIIAELKSKYSYDTLKPKSYHKNRIKELIAWRLLRIKHHYFYIAYDTILAAFVILLLSMIGYVWRKDDFVIILAAITIVVLVVLGFFISISNSRRKNLLKDFEEQFE